MRGIALNRDLKGGRGLELEDVRWELKEAYDVEDWWPSDSPFEVVVGAVLTQQTVWETVSEVLGEMKKEGLLDIRALATSDGRLERTIRPTGFFNQKARSLRGISRYILEKYDGDVMAMLRGRGLEETRAELLSLRGVGNETADSIILFAAGRPKFVAASYVSRVLERTGAFGLSDYEDVQRFVESRLPRSIKAYKEFYALCVHHSKTACLKIPKCDACPLSRECAYALNRTRR